MKIAYLMFVYKNPKLLNRLTKKLSSRDCGFFIHVDQKSNMDEFSAVSGENVFFSEKRIPVYWAEFSGVDAITLLIRQAMKSTPNYDYFILLSGSEYPLRSARYIHDFLGENRNLEFMDIVKMPALGKPISRLNTLRFPSNKPVQRFVGRALAKVGLAQRDYRKYLGSLEPYSGSTWWALTRDACQYMLDFMEDNPGLQEYFQNTFAPEETFFHTILGNSEFKPRIRRNLLYEDWAEQRGHPAMIDRAHVDFFQAHEKVFRNDMYGPGELLFARKFSDDRLDWLEAMDEMIAQKDMRRILRS